MKITGKKILVTGGGSGIGIALAERFIADGNTVIACGRRESALDEARTQLPSLITRQGDLSTADGREDLYSWISSEHPDLQVLVNNAGIQQWMTLSDDDFFTRGAAEIAINVEAPVHLTWLCLKLKSLETIINVTSGLAFVPLAKVPVYCATKAFLRSFTLSLRHLLQTRNMKVIEMIPPALNTDLGGKGIHDFAPPVSGFIESVFAQMEEGKQELTYGYTEHVLHAGWDGLQKTFEEINNR